MWVCLLPIREISNSSYHNFEEGMMVQSGIGVSGTLNNECESYSSRISGHRPWARGTVIFSQPDPQWWELSPGYREGQHWKGTLREF